MSHDSITLNVCLLPEAGTPMLRVEIMTAAGAMQR